ncbi:MAG: hypothetical protein SOZ72_08205 [Treponema sp.]|nr:hypothetical protein [Treponema sp.]
MRLTKIGSCEIENNLSSISVEHLDKTNLKINYNVFVEINLPLSQVSVKVALSYLDGSSYLFNGKLTCTFEIEKLSTFIELDEEKDEFNIKSDFLPSLIALSFSTTRGYFARELIGTALEAYPFPMISSKSLLERVNYQVI